MKQVLKIQLFFLLAAVLTAGLWAGGSAESEDMASEKMAMEPEPMAEEEMDMMDMPAELKGYSVAVFAGGCFWCMEPPFEKLSGVVDVVSGYTGGDEVDPTYEEVAYGKTGHREAVQVYYNPDLIGYEDLLQVFWRQIDPTDGGGSFYDRGNHYTSAIHYANEMEKKLAEKSLADMQASGRFKGTIVTSIEPLMPFYRAEEYHQDYFKKNVIRYKNYRTGSGRDRYIDSIWGDDKEYKVMEKDMSKYSNFDKEERMAELTDLQCYVTQENGTEMAFNNEYWDNKKDGIYVDIVSGEPLFSSTDKYDSGTGWPSFYKTLEPMNIVEVEDRTHGMIRTEVRSTHGDSHLGHLFNDGPNPTGLRYCINSASLRFIPKEQLEEEGYGTYAGLFQ